MSAPLSPERLAEIKSLLRYESSISFHSARAKESMLLLVAEVERLSKLVESMRAAVTGHDCPDPDKGPLETVVSAVIALSEAERRVVELEADAARLNSIAEREHKAFLDTHSALNVLREDANRVMAENGVQAQQAELERVREEAQGFKAHRREWSTRCHKAETENKKLHVRVAELEADSVTLAALEAAGVDNWEGYSNALAGEDW